MSYLNAMIEGTPPKKNHARDIDNDKPITGKLSMEYLTRQILTFGLCVTQRKGTLRVQHIPFTRSTSVFLFVMTRMTN